MSEEKQLAVLRTSAGSRLVFLHEAQGYAKNGFAVRRGTAWKKVGSNQRLLPRFDIKKTTDASDLVVGESARMRPSSPTAGAIIRSGYAKRLDQFADHESRGHKSAVTLFKSRMTPRHKGGVSHKIATETPGRSLLYFPSAGQITSRGVRPTQVDRIIGVDEFERETSSRKNELQG